MPAAGGAGEPASAPRNFNGCYCHSRSRSRHTACRKCGTLGPSSTNQHPRSGLPADCVVPPSLPLLGTFLSCMRRVAPSTWHTGFVPLDSSSFRGADFLSSTRTGSWRGFLAVSRLASNVSCGAVDCCFDWCWAPLSARGF